MGRILQNSMSFTFLSAGTTAVVGFAYPAMQTIKIVKQKPEDPDETTQWVMYWLIFAALYILECLLSVAGVYEYLPLWNEIKVVAMLWLMLPTFQGALWIYLTLMRNKLSQM